MKMIQKGLFMVCFHSIKRGVILIFTHFAAIKSPRQSRGLFILESIFYILTPLSIFSCKFDKFKILSWFIWFISSALHWSAFNCHFKFLPLLIFLKIGKHMIHYLCNSISNLHNKAWQIFTTGRRLQQYARHWVVFPNIVGEAMFYQCMDILHLDGKGMFPDVFISKKITISRRY